MTIYKFPLQIVDEQVISMPEGSRILAVQVQHGIPCLWALVPLNVPSEDITICTHGTGHQFNAIGYVYLGTYQVSGGNFVGHVFRKEAL